MRIANQWNDYRILDTSGQEKLEQWGNVTLIRPDPQIIWKTPKEHGMWNHADGHYHRSNAGGGSWDFFRKLPESWNIQYTPLDLKFRIQPTSFKHTGLFPEQAVNWDFVSNLIQTHFCLESVCLYRRCNAGLCESRSERLPCRCIQGNDTVGKRKCSTFRTV